MPAFCATSCPAGASASTPKKSVTPDPDALNPFCDTTVTNNYDRYDRGRVTDIASRVANAWRTGPSGAYTATDRDDTAAGVGSLNTRK